MSKKTVRMNNRGIDRIPNDKPVVYKILSKRDLNIYTGIAGKGNVRDRLEDHMPGHKDAVPRAFKVQIEQVPTIRDAERKEANIIVRSKPRYNQQGK